MKKILVFCLLVALLLSFDRSSVWAIDVGWMQIGVRVWYMGEDGSADAYETFLFTSIDGNNAQLTHHSAVTHWTLPNQPDPETGSILDKGPCWIHPQVLQTLQSGDLWQGNEIVTVVPPGPYTYDTLLSQFPSFPYLLLPIKALFDLNPQRNLVKIVYMIAGSSTGMAYFDADTGLLLVRENSNGLATVWFILSEINYNFATHVAFAEDNGPHTGFKSNVSEQQMSSSHGFNSFSIQSSVETRYGGTVQMWTTTTENGTSPPNENYCFFGSVPVLRHKLMTATPQYPPEGWNAYGEYLWWWVPAGVLQNSTINVFGVPMTRTDTNPYTFTATQQPAGFFYSKLWFDNDGYMTAFAAKHSATGLDIDPGYTDVFLWNKSITIDGLDYYKNTMGIATPVSGAVVYTDFAGYGLCQWNGSAWSQIHPLAPTNMVASGSVLYATWGGGLWAWNGSAWSQIHSLPPTLMAASGSALYATWGGGLWEWNGSAWSQIHSLPPTLMAASGSSLYTTWGGAGLWKWNGTSWSQLHTIAPVNMVASSGSILYATWASGLYKWNGSAWSQIHPLVPTNMVASGSVLYATWGGAIWEWNGSAWSQIHPLAPAHMAASGPALYTNWTGAGIWIWNGTTWSQQLTPTDPTVMVAGF